MDCSDAFPFTAPFEFKNGGNGCLSALRITHQFEAIRFFFDSFIMQIFPRSFNHIGACCSCQSGM